MRFLADMGVAMRVVEWLREQRHDAAHLRDENLQRMPDPEIFRKAALALFSSGKVFDNVVAQCQRLRTS